jgi:CRP-like cAMP-binding protein
MNNNLKVFLESMFGPMPEREWTLLAATMQPSEVAKNEEVHPIGKRCKHLWFLEKGAVKVYEITNGEERNTHFFTAHSLFIDYHSIATKTPSEIGFRAVEDCTIYALDYEALLKTYDQSQYLERIGRMMAERQFVMEFELRRLLLNYNARERYNYLLQKQPEIFQRFSLKDIASFIGVTPVSLSRLRKSK